MPSRRRPLAFLSLLTIAGACFCASAAFAAPYLPAIVVHRSDTASDCPDAEALAALVGEQIRRPALRPVADLAPELGLGLDVAIFRAGGTYVAVVEINGKTRRLADDHPSCAGLSNALVVSLAVLLDTEPILPLPPPPPPPPPLPELPAEPPASPPAERPVPEPPVALPESAPVHAWASAGPLLTAGFLNALAGGIAGEVGFGWSRYSVALGALYLPGAPSPFSSGTVQFSLAAGSFRACARFVGDPELGLSLCAASILGVVEGKSGTAAAPSRAANPWVALGGGLAFHQRLVGALTWGARAEVDGIVVNDRFTDSNSGNVAFSPSNVGVLGSVELRLSIW